MGTKSNDDLNIWVRISQQIGELNAFIKTALDKLADHEKRIDVLEKDKGCSLKDTAIQWLLKGLIASIFIIGSLTGAGSLLKGIFSAQGDEMARQIETSYHQQKNLEK